MALYPGSCPPHAAAAEGQHHQRGHSCRHQPGTGIRGCIIQVDCATCVSCRWRSFRLMGRWCCGRLANGSSSCVIGCSVSKFALRGMTEVLRQSISVAHAWYPVMQYRTQGNQQACTAPVLHFCPRWRHAAWHHSPSASTRYHRQSSQTRCRLLVLLWVSVLTA
jgi:hypothetical protein